MSRHCDGEAGVNPHPCHCELRDLRPVFLHRIFCSPFVDLR